MEARKPSRQGVNARTADTRLRNANPRRAHIRSLAARAGCWLLTIAALLPLPVQTQAQTTIWSSTLTVKSVGTNLSGCNESTRGAECSTNLSKDGFTYDRKTYRLLNVYTYPPDLLRMTVHTDLPANTKDLTLNVNNRTFRFEDGDLGNALVRRWNNAGFSWTPGDTVSLTITDPHGTPGTPETPTAPAVGATDGSTTSLDVGWLKPTLAGPFVKYYIRSRQSVRHRWIDGPQDVTTTFARITRDLEAGTTYEVQVLANNNNGDSDWSPSGIGRTDSGEAPGAPSNLTATANGEDRINLSWTAPSSEGGTIPSNPGEPDNEMDDDRIRSYKIEVRSAASNWLVLDRTIGSTDTEYSHRDV